MKPEEGGIAFVADLRDARGRAQASLEDAAPLFVAFERLGYHCALPDGPPRGLGDYEASLLEICRASPLSDALEKSPGESTARDLFESLVAGRNERMHVGIAARRTTEHAVRFALMLEAGLMSTFETAAHFMVRGPVCAEAWQTLAQVRQTMLTHQFSVLPFRAVDKKWVLLSDINVAKYLYRVGEGRPRALVAKLGDLIPTLKPEDLSEAKCVGPSWRVTPATFDGAPAPSEALSKRVHANVLLVTEDGKSDSNLLGIITPFDLL